MIYEMNIIKHQLCTKEESKEIEKQLLELLPWAKKHIQYPNPYNNDQIIEKTRKQLNYTTDGLIMYYGEQTVPYRWIELPVQIKILRWACNKCGINWNCMIYTKYDNKNKYIAPHKDKEWGWDKKAGFACFQVGQKRDTIFISDSKQKYIYKPEFGELIHVKPPTN